MQRPEQSHETEIDRNHAIQPPPDWEERKQRVLTQGAPSITEDIADAVVIKNENIFFLSRPDGSVPLSINHGLGLYYHDCRYLNGYEVKIAGTVPTSLVASSESGYRALLQLTNPDIRGHRNILIPKENIGIRWERTVDNEELALYDTFTLQNYERTPATFDLAFTFRAGFEDVFAVRGLLGESEGRIHKFEWRDGELHTLYEGADHLRRALRIAFSPLPVYTPGEHGSVTFPVALGGHERKDIHITITVDESEKGEKKRGGITHTGTRARVAMRYTQWENEWLSGMMEVRTDSVLLGTIMKRSLRDLCLLQSTIDGGAFLAAGIPWFATLFGRDSIIASFQALAYTPKLAEGTLRLLARYQGKEVNDWRDEQPGKILHELRVGEMAQTGQIPHSPYYGSIDATPLFLILVCRHAHWSGNLALFHELRPAIDAALEWIARYGDIDGDGYIEYASSSQAGLINQGWKDSGDAIVTASGDLAAPPIALAEVQAYVYLAKISLADLFDRAGDQARAASLRQEAHELRARFNRDFWCDTLSTYALALDGKKQRLEVVSSNPGHTLWAGIADEENARMTVQRLMAPDMFSGWGVRTLSEKEKGYNPMGYHLGTVWPHENAFIAAGFHAAGYASEALRIFNGLTRATMYFEHYRLPEVFCGFSKDEFGIPVRYPVACHPQAWASGSIPFLLSTFLGLVPDGFAHSLRIVRPVIPDLADYVELHRLPIAGAHVGLRFERISPSGEAAVHVLSVDGTVDIHIEQ